MSKTNKGLVEYAKYHLGNPYWYGTYGQTANEALYKQKKSQYPAQYPPKKWTEQSFTSQYGKQVFDCAGLIKGYMFSETPSSTPIYNGKYDVSANTMISLCKEQGDYSRIPNIAGLIVWKSGHVGVYLGNGKTIEAKGHAYGVVTTTDTNWLKWGMLPWLEYEAEPDVPVVDGDCMVMLPKLQKGSKNKSVERLQILLKGLGYRDQYGEELKIDGSFGGRTEYAVKLFQSSNKLTADGIVGASTWRALLGA